MDAETARRLVELNRFFYAGFAEPFAGTRSEPQPGFRLLADAIPDGHVRVLDVGCGEGRFGRFLRETGRSISYTGIDMTAALLERARTAEDDVLIVCDISRPGCFDGLGQFDCVACLSTLQHIPGHANRVRLLREMGGRLAPEGRIMLGNWQFLDSSRQRRKLRDWSLAGLRPEDVEPGDYLLSWQRSGSGLRYVAYLDLEQTERMVRDAGLRLLQTFRSDGREGNLNLYSLLAC